MNTSHIGGYHAEERFVSCSQRDLKCNQELQSELQEKLACRVAEATSKSMGDVRTAPPVPEKKMKKKRLPLKPLNVKKSFFAVLGRASDPKSPQTPTIHLKPDVYIEKLYAVRKE